MNGTNFSILTSFRRRLKDYQNYNSLTILYVFRAAQQVEQNSVVPLARASKLIEATSAETVIFYRTTKDLTTSNHISNEWYVIETTESIEPFVDSILSGCRESIRAILCRNLPTKNKNVICILLPFSNLDKSLICNLSRPLSGSVHIVTKYTK